MDGTTKEKDRYRIGFNPLVYLFNKIYQYSKCPKFLIFSTTYSFFKSKIDLKYFATLIRFYCSSK